MTFFECYADEILLKHLGFSKRNTEHSFGRSSVCFKLSKSSSSIGLIDEDPNSPKEPYLKYLYTLQPAYEDEYLICFNDKKQVNKLIVIRPNLEEWSLRLARDKQIDLVKQYNLSNNVKKLHEDLMLSKNLKKFQSFGKFLSDISDHTALVKIKELIKT